MAAASGEIMLIELSTDTSIERWRRTGVDRADRVAGHLERAVFI
jgi:hypothetical protein